MKKIIAITAVVLVIIISLTAFVACDKKGEEQDISVNTKFEDIVSEKITQEKWNALLEKPADEINNFRIYVYGYTNYGAVPDLSYNSEVIETDLMIEVKDGVMHEVLTHRSGGGNDYEKWVCPDKDNLWRVFVYDNPMGLQEQWEELEYEVRQEGVDLLDMNVMPYIAYEEFEYSEEHKGYVYEREEGSTDVIMTIIKFQDGNVVACREKETYDNELVQEITIVYDFGKVENIEIPEEVQEMLKKPYDGDIVFPD